MLCEGCSLKQQIQSKRCILNQTVLEKELDLTDQAVLQISEELDQLIVSCLKCQNNLTKCNNYIKQGGLINGK